MMTMTDWDLSTRDVPRARRGRLVVGGTRVIGDCRVPDGHMAYPAMVDGTPHSCHLDDPCEARQLFGRHSHDADSSMTHTLNVARRNATPYQPRHCACRACVLGFTHVAQVVPRGRA